MHGPIDKYLLKILPGIVAVTMIASLAPPAFADTSLTLDPIPERAYEGQTVTFTGVLYADGSPLAGKRVYIQEDKFLRPDEVLTRGWTDQNGRFSIDWHVRADSIETEFEIYAIFEGDSHHKKDRTRNQEMDVFERRGTAVILNPIPGHVYAGDAVTFTGTLTHGGQPLAGKRVYIQDEDEFRPDDYLKSGTTDQYGRFHITWIAKVDRFEDEREIRAVFEGDQSYGRDASRIQDMYVTKIGGDITLDPPPSTAKVGQTVTFSGTLGFDRGNPGGIVVHIKDEDSFSRDELLATGYVGSNGRFSANWIVDYTDFDSTVDIFAVFEGDDRYDRQATCSSTCGDTFPLRISGRVDPSPPPSPPVSTIPDNAEYIELYRSLSFNRPPHVAIIPEPDSYNQVKGHIVPVQEGIMMWTTGLEGKYGGNWDVTFDVVVPGERFESRPDVIVNLVTAERQERCLRDGSGITFGWAQTLASQSEPINTTVCSTLGDRRHSNYQVSGTAAHEFIHAVGLGHTFNKPGDMMCSVENGIPTCDSASKNYVPSSLNLAGVTHLYGLDGFPNPNNRVEYKSKFAEGGQTDSPPVTAPDPRPLPTTRSFPNDCDTNDKRYNINLQNHELKPGWYRWYTICNTGTVQYSFSVPDRNAGISLYVLPPETDVGDYVKDGKGYHYPCEDPDKRWYSKPGVCYVRAGSSIVIHNDRDVSITIDGSITTDVARQSFPNNCTTDSANYDFTTSVTLRPGWFIPYTICNTGDVQYSFSVPAKNGAFALHVLPPEIDVSGYVYDGRGYHYTCEDPDDHWYSKSNSCNVIVGSRIALHNDSNVPITIDVRIRT